MLTKYQIEKIKKLVELANARTPIAYGTRKFSRVASIHWIKGERVIVFLVNDDMETMQSVYLEDLDI